MPIDDESLANFQLLKPSLDDGVNVEPNPFPSGGTELQFESIRKYANNATLTRAFIEAGTYEEIYYQPYLVRNLYCRYLEGGWTSPNCQEARSQVLEFFYPQGEDWRNLTHAHFGTMWRAFMDGLHELGAVKPVVDAVTSGCDRKWTSSLLLELLVGLHCLLVAAYISS